MTDKEQIMIDNVSDFCLVCYYDNKNKELVRIEQYKDNSGDIQTDIESHKYGYNAKIIKPEELIKQLARKTQECEELKRKVELMMDCPDCKVDEYKKALEEIEEYIYTDCEYNDGCDRNICIRCKYSNVHDKRILDIINKVRGYI